MVDLTPGPEVYRACAEASWGAPGTQRLWSDKQRETYIELMLARPDWRALVDAAYRAGREDAARSMVAAVVAGNPPPVRPGQQLTAEALRAWLGTLAEQAGIDLGRSAGSGPVDTSSGDEAAR